MMAVGSTRKWPLLWMVVVLLLVGALLPSTLAFVSPPSRALTVAARQRHHRLHSSSSSSSSSSSDASPPPPSVLDTIRAGDATAPPPERVALPIPDGYTRVEIEYCTGCRWMLRAAWIAQELLTTFQDQLDEVAIQPGRSSGVFDIYVNNQRIWSRKTEGRFPEAKEIKQRVRDVIDPDRDLGHSDVGGKKKAVGEG